MVEVEKIIEAENNNINQNTQNTSNTANIREEYLKLKQKLIDLESEIQVLKEQIKANFPVVKSIKIKRTNASVSFISEREYKNKYDKEDYYQQVANVYVAISELEEKLKELQEIKKKLKALESSMSEKERKEIRSEISKQVSSITNLTKQTKATQVYKEQVIKTGKALAKDYKEGESKIRRESARNISDLFGRLSTPMELLMGIAPATIVFFIIYVYFVPLLNNIFVLITQNLLDGFLLFPTFHDKLPVGLANVLQLMFDFGLWMKTILILLYGAFVYKRIVQIINKERVEILKKVSEEEKQYF